MNSLSREDQIAVISALTEGLSIRSVERLTGIHRETIMRLGARVGKGCAELHDRRMVGVRTGRLELDELWAFVGKKQAHVQPREAFAKGDQYTFVALASTSRAIVSYRTGKRDGATTDEFVQDLRERIIGSPPGPRIAHAGRAASNDAGHGARHRQACVVNRRAIGRRAGGCTAWTDLDGARSAAAVPGNRGW